MNTKPESGFGGWADEMIRTAREAAPLLSQRKASTIFDNISLVPEMVLNGNLS